MLGGRWPARQCGILVLRPRARGRRVVRDQEELLRLALAQRQVAGEPDRSRCRAGPSNIWVKCASSAVCNSVDGVQDSVRSTVFEALEAAVVVGGFPALAPAGLDLEASHWMAVPSTSWVATSRRRGLAPLRDDRAVEADRRLADRHARRGDLSTVDDRGVAVPPVVGTFHCDLPLADGAVVCPTSAPRYGELVAGPSPLFSVRPRWPARPCTRAVIIAIATPADPPGRAGGCFEESFVLQGSGTEPGSTEPAPENEEVQTGSPYRPLLGGSSSLTFRRSRRFGG